MRLASLLAATALAVAACGSDEPTTAGAPSSSTEPATSPATSEAPGATAGPGADVPEFLAFEAPDVRGGQVVGSDYAGSDLVIWFWAPW